MTNFVVSVVFLAIIGPLTVWCIGQMLDHAAPDWRWHFYCWRRRIDPTLDLSDFDPDREDRAP